jgi:hypothetical protein
MWHNYINEKNRTSLDFHNHFANYITIKKKIPTTPPLLPKAKNLSPLGCMLHLFISHHFFPNLIPETIE